MENNKKNILIILIAAVLAIVLFFGYQIAAQKLDVSKGCDYLQEKEYEKAYKSFSKAENRYTVFTSKKNIQYYEGECLIYLGRYDEAASIYKEILKKNSEARAYAMQGFALQQNGNGEEAVSAYENAIAEDKKDGIGYYYLYGYYIESKDYKKALEVIQKAQEVPVTSMEQEIAYAKIVAYEKLLKYDKALEAANAYCKAYPDDAVGQQEKAFLETR